MNVFEIKKAVNEGKTVIWSNPSYVVKATKSGNMQIVCCNGSCIGLTWADGVTLNGKEEDFRIVE